jgi:hypothetical protein
MCGIKKTINNIQSFLNWVGLLYCTCLLSCLVYMTVLRFLCSLLLVGLCVG